MKILISIVAMLFVVSCSHSGQKGDHKGHSHKDGKMCGGDHKKEGCQMCGDKKHKHSKGDKKLKKMDADKDGKVSKAEFDKKHEDKFKKMDKNSDGFLTKDELESCGCAGGHKH